MRILMLATTVPVAVGDGTPSFVLDGAIGLGEDTSVTIVAPSVGGSAPSVHFGSVKVRRFRYLPRRWERLADEAIMPQLARHPSRWLQALALSASMTVAAIRIHRDVRPDVVHAHWIIPSGAIALLLRIVCGTPYVVTSHGADAFTMDRPPFASLKNAVVARASRFIAVSEEILSRFQLVTERGVVQPCGVDLKLWDQLVGERRAEQGRVLFIGRLDVKKGVDIAIRAIAEVPEAQLRIVGDGPERAALDELARSVEVVDRVIFLGRATRDATAAELRCATCIVIPSIVASDGDREGTPVVLGEAVAARVPVVASAMAGIRDRIVDRESGLLVPPGDAEALRDALKEILSDPDLAQTLASAARSRLADALSLEVAAERHREWYRSAARGD